MAHFSDTRSHLPTSPQPPTIPPVSMTYFRRLCRRRRPYLSASPRLRQQVIFQHHLQTVNHVLLDRWTDTKSTAARSGTVLPCRHSISFETPNTGCVANVMRTQHSYFSQYSPLMRIIDPSLSPDKCFSLSQFLFWAIVFVGSRRYSRDPTLLGRLAPRINSMALQALGTRANPIETIQGLLILCVWPVPLNTMYKDITTVLSGAATHLAMQIGLHVVGSGQDFSRTRLDSGYEDKLFRAQLWAHCLIISHE